MSMLLFSGAGDVLTSYNVIIASSVIIILSFFFTQISQKTNIPSVLMLIVLGMILKVGLDASGTAFDFFPILQLLGIIGLIMIVLEAALELKLEKEKTVPILLAMGLALIGLLVSAFIAKAILQYFIADMTSQQAWVYATPLSILSSAIIIPSVSGLRSDKKEFHIYESTFSDIFGIMMFYFLVGNMESETGGTGVVGFTTNLILTIVISLIASYAIIIIFQNIKTHVKLFLLIAILLLLYAIGKKLHLSSLIIILIFGLLIANMELFFSGKLRRFLNYRKAKHIYDELHTITLETAFVVRTFFFVIFGITITLSSLFDGGVAIVSLLIIASIYLIRYTMLRATVGKDILPQVYVAPRGLITILLFYAIPESLQLKTFNSGILLFVIIATSIIMTIAMIADKRRSNKAIDQAQSTDVGYVKWRAKGME
ncbi:MAG: cation:proton antiporter [Saprospiraceae bacterium]